MRASLVAYIEAEILPRYAAFDKAHREDHARSIYGALVAEGGYLHLLIPGSPNEEPLQRLREIIRDEAYLRSIFETCYLEETKTMIDDILLYNKKFVAEKGYEPYVTDKFPAKKLAVLTCMDTRLTELLPKALGLQNGDAKIIKNAGGVMLSERDSAIRSLLVAIYELGVNEVMVVHHSGCGACHMGYVEFKPHMLERGISAAVLSGWEKEGIGEWLEGFHDTEASVRKTVAAIVNHPLVPSDVTVRGFVIDSVTGALTEVK